MRNPFHRNSNKNLFEDWADRYQTDVVLTSPLGDIHITTDEVNNAVLIDFKIYASISYKDGLDPIDMEPGDTLHVEFNPDEYIGYNA